MFSRKLFQQPVTLLVLNPSASRRGLAIQPSQHLVLQQQLNAEILRLAKSKLTTPRDLLLFYERNLRRFGPVNCATLLTSVALSAVTHHQVHSVIFERNFDLLSRRIFEELPNYGGRSLASVARAYSLIGFLQPDLHLELWNCAEEKFNEMEPKQLVHLGQTFFNYELLKTDPSRIASFFSSTSASQPHKTPEIKTDSFSVNNSNSATTTTSPDSSPSSAAALLPHKTSELKADLASLIPTKRFLPKIEKSALDQVADFRHHQVLPFINYLGELQQQGNHAISKPLVSAFQKRALQALENYSPTELEEVAHVFTKAGSTETDILFETVRKRAQALKINFNVFQ